MGCWVVAFTFVFPCFGMKGMDGRMDGRDIFFSAGDERMNQSSNDRYMKELLFGNRRKKKRRGYESGGDEMRERRK